MRFLLIIFVLFILSAKQQCHAQSAPFRINIKLKKSYDLKLPRSEFENRRNSSEYKITTDSVIEKQFEITITIKNTSIKEAKFWLMTCSWWDNFLINNNYMFFKPNDCMKNFPILEKLKPGESKKIEATLTKSIKFDYACENCIYGQQVKDTKIGLIMISDVLAKNSVDFIDYHLFMENKSRWKILWSNSL